MKRNIRHFLILIIIITLLASYLSTTNVIATATTYYMEISDLPYNNKFITAVQSPRTNDILAIDEEGSIWAWGDNLYGIHGNGSKRGSKTPTKISSTTKFKQIVTNGYVSVAIDKQGNIWACGDNYTGGYACVGNEYDLENYNTNRVITSFTKITSDTQFTKVCIGQNAVLALDKNGNIWGWGSNDSGILLSKGKGNKENPYSEYRYYQNVPKQLTNGKIYKDIDISGSNAGAIDSNNNLYVWGSNLKCQLSAPRDIYTYKTNENANFTVNGSYDPILIGTKKFNKFVIGDTMHAIDTEGYLWTWGSIGMTGLRHSYITGSDYDSTAKCFYTPRKVDENKYSDVYEGLNMRYALKVDKSSGYPLVAWGTDVPSTILGMDNEIKLDVRNSEVPIALYKQDITMIPESDLAFDENGNLWGWQFEYKNAEGNAETATAPTQITGKTQFTVTFMDGITIISTQTINKGSSAIAPTLTKAGYTYRWDTDFSNVTEDLTVRAIWTANTDTPYTIEHYLRTIDTEVEGYKKEVEQKRGTTDSTAVATPKSYTGFTENRTHSNRVPTGTITADGSLVLKLYYDRNTYNITYELNGGTPSGTLANSYLYGKETYLSNKVTKPGYNFAGWYDNSELTGNAITSIPENTTGDKTFYAKWTANQYTVTFKDREQIVKTQTVNYGENAIAPILSRPGYTYIWDKSFENVSQDLIVNALWTANINTPYTIEYYLRTIDTEVEGYQKEVEQKQGTTDSTITATPKSFRGFTENEAHPNRVATGKITADGNLVLKLYYDRNKYDITYELNGGTQTGTPILQYTYGKEFILPNGNKVTKPGYNFAGWYDNSELTGNPVTSIPENEIGNKTFYAKWVLEDLYYVTSEKHSINTEENYITKVSPNTNVETFIRNITTNGTKKVVNAKNEEVTGNALVGTGYKLQVTYKGETYEYEIAVRGDLDGNGRITITDLSTLNKIRVGTLKVTGIREKAADLDYNGRITITDLSMMNQALTRKITL